MTLYIRRVPSTHHVCQFSPSDRLCESARDFWLEHLANTCDEAMVATSGGEVVGFVRYDVVPPKGPFGVQVYAVGTWVHPDFQRNGIGLKMWERLLHHHKPEIVQVEAVTLAGEGFIHSMWDKWPDIIWR